MSVNYILRGDVTCEGEVSADDAEAIRIAYVHALAHEDPGLTQDQLNIGDVNGDGEVSIDDAQRTGVYYASVVLAGHGYDWDDILLGGLNSYSEEPLEETPEETPSEDSDNDNIENDNESESEQE